MWLRFAVVALLICLGAQRAFGVERTVLRESAGVPASVGTEPCPLSTSTNGTAANYRWYNFCSGYIWIVSGLPPGDAVGVLFGGPSQPEVKGGNIVKRAITYYRNVVSSRSYNVIVYLDADIEGDGCPDYNLAYDWGVDPGLRWNCTGFNVTIPCDLDHLILRTALMRDLAPTFATDGPYSAECDPESPRRSFYYPVGTGNCIPWVGPDGDPDNFPYWLVIDSADPCPPNAAESRSWGAIKGLFR